MNLNSLPYNTLHSELYFQVPRAKVEIRCRKYNNNGNDPRLTRGKV